MFIVKAEIISYQTENVIGTRYILNEDYADFQDWVFKVYGGNNVYIKTEIKNLWKNRKRG